MLTQLECLLIYDNKDRNYSEYSTCLLFTRSECQGEFLGLDLGDLFKLLFLGHVFIAVGNWLVLVDDDASTWVLHAARRAISFLQGLQIITAS